MMNVVKYIFIILLITYVILAASFALYGYPLFRQDAICFLPTSYFINHQHQLINSLYDAGIDPVNHKFLFYPPLFPYAVAAITKLLPNIPTNIHIALTVINVCGLIILSRCGYLYILINIKKKSSFLTAFLAVWMIGLFSLNEIFEGRPEILCNFFIACFLLNNVNKFNVFTNYINGFIIGLNAITSPISTIYLTIITIGLLFYKGNFKLKSVLHSATGFLLVTCCFSLLYPYHLIDLFHGLIKHSSNVVVNRASAGTDRLIWFKNIYILTPFHPLIGITFITALVYLIYLLVKQRKFSSIVCLFFLLVTVENFAFRNVLMSYNMYVLAYPCMFLLLALFIDIINKRILLKFTKLTFCIIFLLLTCNVFGFIRTSLVFIDTIQRNVSIESLNNDIDRLSKNLNEDKKIYVTFSLWPACLSNNNSIVSNTILGAPVDNPELQYIVIQQSNTGQIEAPLIPNYKLIKNTFIKDHPTFLNYSIGNTYPFYQAAIYERIL